MGYHVVSTFDVTAPASAKVNESRRSSRIERFMVRDEDGEIVKLRGGRKREIDITLRGKGDPGFAAVQVGAFVIGTPKIISAEGTEFNSGDFNDFEITAKNYENGASAGGAGSGAGTAFQLGDFAITSISTARTTQVRLKHMVEVGEVTLDEDGEAVENVTYGELWEFSIDGTGDLPADGAIGGAGPSIAYVTGGISLVESTDENEEVGRSSTWSFSGVNAPNAD